MPLQSLFTNALLSDIHSSHLLQQTIAALQANKFVQVKLINIAYGCLFFKHICQELNSGHQAHVAKAQTSESSQASFMTEYLTRHTLREEWLSSFSPSSTEVVLFLFL